MAFFAGMLFSQLFCMKKAGKISPLAFVLAILISSWRKLICLSSRYAFGILEGAFSMSHNTIKVLVVDDEEAMQEVLQMRLQEWEFDVCLAEDGVLGRELAKSYNPDIV